MENKSLSSRIKRRNVQGFVDVGNSSWTKRNKYGDYTNIMQNGKEEDYAREQKRKNKLGFKRVIGMNGLPYSLHKRALTKKFADNHQKIS